MLIKEIQDETFQDYKEVSMLIVTCFCDWKCCIEAGNDICQNSSLASKKNIEISNKVICKRYLQNKITKAIIFGGLEPMLQFEDMYDIIDKLRNKYHSNDEVIIYTGYTESEISEKIELLSKFSNIIIKVGRFLPTLESKYDDILGIKLASSNQYAIKI